MMKLLVIAGNVSKTPDGVTYSFVFDEIYRLAKRGFEVHAVRSRIDKDDYLYNIYFHGLEEGLGINEFFSYIWRLGKIHPLGFLRNPKVVYWEGKYHSRIVKVVEECKTDIIHAHFAYPEGLVGMLTAKKVKKPLVVTVHGYDVLTEPTVGYGIRLSKRLDLLVKKV
ncbi:MAG: glycosyltransferase, partial [Desulfurococcaceae archaeon]